MVPFFKTSITSFLIKSSIALVYLIKQLTEMALQAELETHLSQDLERNRKNGVRFIS